MLRIHVEPMTEGVRIRLEGKLVRPEVEELARAWWGLLSTYPRPHAIQVDLGDVSFVDAGGRTLLAAMRTFGCGLVGKGPFIDAVIEEIESLSTPPTP